MKNYIVVESSDKVYFHYLMNEAMKAGYEITGGLSVQQIIAQEQTVSTAQIRELHYAQGMVKTTVEVSRDTYEDEHINIAVSAHMHVVKDGDVVNIWDMKHSPSDFPVVIIKLKKETT